MKLVSYLRVSTKRQGQSGLGIDAQRSAVIAHATSVSGAVIAEYVEIESGKRADRPELARAIAHCKATDAMLVVAKLDRLSRNVAFLAALMDAGVPFVACDNPQANRLTLHILAAVAENEAAAISARTKAALAEAKRRGVLLGASDARCRNLTRADRAKGSTAGGDATKKACADFRAALAPIFHELIGKTPAEIAAALNARGYVTKRGLAWNRKTVQAMQKGLSL